MSIISSLAWRAAFVVMPLGSCGNAPGVNPELGVYGFPDCTRNNPSLVVSDVQAEMDLHCQQKQSAPETIRIACVGDSLTAGVGAADSSTTYPAQLQMLLDQDYGPGIYSVTNLGASGTAVELMNDYAYWHTPQFNALSNAKWDIIIIMLGTNDAKTPLLGCGMGNTLDNCAFADDYRALIDFSAKLGRDPAVSPDIYMMTPPPVMMDGAIGISQDAVNSVLQNLIPWINSEIKDTAGLINIFAAMGGSTDWASRFPAQCSEDSALPSCRWYCDSQGCDQVHPNNAGYHHIAIAVEAELMQGKFLGALLAGRRLKSDRSRQVAMMDGLTLV